MVRFEYSEGVRAAQKMDHVRVTGEDLMGLVDSHQLFGLWRTELDTGHVFWSSDIFEIYGMEFTDGPINLTLSNAAMHPDDLPYLLELFEHSAEQKTGFHYILRVKDGPSRYKHVRAVGRYRVTPADREELYGFFQQMHDHVPLVGLVAPVPQGELRLA